jgi:surfactin synthase thioesterase subunit/MFS family permease
LSQHLSVQASVVMAREDIPGDRRLVAYVVNAPNQSLAPGELRTYLKQQLPEYMVPSVIMPLAALPVTPNGKLDRRALPVPDLARPEIQSNAVAPRNELEARIMAIWSEILGLETLGIDDNFFDLGGESFKAVRAVRKISDSLGVMQLFLHPTIRQLAESMAGEQNQGPHRLLQELTPPVAVGARTVSLVCIPFAGGSPIMYQPMARAMPAGISLFAVEVPGHDFVLRSEPLQPIGVVAARCVQEIQEHVPGPIALFGHCLGGSLAIEIARRLEATGRPLVGIFIAGHFPTPRLPGKLFELFHRLFPSEKWTSHHTIIDSLRAMGFFTEVVDPQEQDFVVHNMQQEVSEINDYYTRIYQNPAARLKSPIQCIMGQMDRSTELYEERYKEWEFFSASVSLVAIPKAGHYFPKHQASEVAAIVTAQLAQWQQSPLSGVAQTRAEPTQPAPLPQQPARPAVKASLATFFTVAIGQLISLIGTGLTTFALSVWVYQQTRSITYYAFIMVCAILPAIVVIPFGGAVADRFDRRKIMLACDSASGVISATIATLLAIHALHLWEVYILASLASITVAFQQPAYLAAVTQLTPKRYYGRANGLVELGTGTGAMLAPLMGGLLAALIGLSGVVYIDMATFLIAVTATLLVRFPNSLWRKREEPFLKEVLGGWRYVWKRRGLVSLVLFTTGANYVFAITDVLVTPLVLSLGNVGILGLVLAANGAGVVAGSLVMGIWGGTRRRVNGIIAANLLLGFSCAVIGLRANALFPILGLFGTGFAVAIINAHWLSLIQNKVGMELQGRVVSVNLMLVMAMVPLGFITASPLANGVFTPIANGQGAFLVHLLLGTGPERGVGLLLVLAGLLIVVWAIAAYQYRPIRHLEDDLTDVFANPVIEQDKDLLQSRADQLLLKEHKI